MCTCTCCFAGVHRRSALQGAAFDALSPHSVTPHGTPRSPLSPKLPGQRMARERSTASAQLLRGPSPAQRSHGRLRPRSADGAPSAAPQKQQSSGERSTGAGARAPAAACARLLHVAAQHAQDLASAQRNDTSHAAASAQSGATTMDAARSHRTTNDAHLQPQAQVDMHALHVAPAATMPGAAAADTQMPVHRSTSLQTRRKEPQHAAAASAAPSAIPALSRARRAPAVAPPLALPAAAHAQHQMPQRHALAHAVEGAVRENIAAGASGIPANRRAPQDTAGAVSTPTSSSVLHAVHALETQQMQASGGAAVAAAAPPVMRLRRPARMTAYDAAQAAKAAQAT